MSLTTRAELMLLALAGAYQSLSAQCPAPRENGARRIPAYFETGRVLAAPRTTRGDTAFFILDSGGGFNAIMDTRVAALHLATQFVHSGNDTATVVSLSSFVDPAFLPAPVAGYPHDGTLVVTHALTSMAPHYGVPITGFLGGGWWADRVWQIDYLRLELWLYPHLVLKAGSANAHVIPLAFRTNGAGARPTNFARIRALIDGDSLDLLFDTGATTLITDSARAVLGDNGPKARAGSFISASIFDRWHARHPGWRVVERGEAGTQATLIEVPAMQLAGYAVGPVIWEKRGDTNFHKLMDPLMDRPIQGSLGGAAFQFFSITVDYPSSLACFER
ncbi:MAG TPA: hypothetical protein VII52_13115 [Gemmatimonadaceae bacterium]